MVSCVSGLWRKISCLPEWHRRYTFSVIHLQSRSENRQQERKIYLTPVHIPGAENKNARSTFYQSDGMTIESALTLQDFSTTFYPVDLFASRLNFQIPCYVSWKQDPMSSGEQMFFSILPFTRKSGVLQKVITGNPLLILITPDWKTES